MTSPNQSAGELPAVSRREFVLGAATGIVVTAGCLDTLSEDEGPQEHSFDVTITSSGGVPEGTVEGADIEDVVQVHVGDTVDFTFTNETDEPVGVHDHASDSEVVIEPGSEASTSFEVTEAMVGRQEIEAWFADDADSPSDGGHEADATAIVIVEVRPRGN